MMAPLARDQQGNAFELPTEAAYWRVRRNTGGRPADVLGTDGEPLYAPIADDRLELRGKGCSGSIRLEAVDADRKSLGIQAAYVELGNGDDNAQRSLATNGDKDLVRTCFDSMTRTMESMQRAQVERERTLAQKEQSITEAQIASQKMMVEMMLALLERTGGAKPQDALSVLRQQFEIQKTIDKQTNANRNAAPLLPAPVAQIEDDGIPKWLRTAVPMVLMGGQELAVNLLAKDDPAKAEMVRRSMSGVASMLAGGGGIPFTPPMLTAAPAIPVGEIRPAPKAIREILALLDDEESHQFESQLADLDDVQYAEVCAAVNATPSLEDRLAWARSTIRAGADQPPPIAAQASAAEISGIPPQLVPVLMQLSPDEQMMGMQILSWLDRETTEKVTADLLSLPSDTALTKIRQMIEEARRRGPSVAQRAVASVFASGRNGAGRNGVTNGGSQ